MKSKSAEVTGGSLYKTWKSTSYAIGSSSPSKVSALCLAVS